MSTFGVGVTSASIEVMAPATTLQAASPERTSSRRSGEYIPTLDGWRAVAIIAVLFGHAEVWSWGRFSTRWLHDFGEHGVPIFFALSGFLICTRLLREEDALGAISLRSFYTRRLFRIQPAALVYLLAVALLGVLGILTWYGPGVAGAVLMVRNVWPPYSIERPFIRIGHRLASRFDRPRRPQTEPIPSMT